MVEIY